MNDRFGDAKRILLAGAGGGYDVLGAVPLVAELEADGRDVHLASLSFTYLNGLDRARHIAEVGCLYEVTGDAAVEHAYRPEAHLAAFLERPIGASTRPASSRSRTRTAGSRASSRSISSC